MAVNTAIECAMSVSGSRLAGCDSNARRACGVGPGRRREPLVVMISVRLATRSGQWAAMCCAIMPPSEAPTTCARAMPSASSTPTASAAMSLTA